MKWSDRRRIAAPCLLALALVAAVPALAAEDPLLEDPAGVLGVAPTPVGGFTATFGGGLQRGPSGPNRDTWIGAIEAEAGLLPGMDLRFVQGAGRGAAAPYPADETQRVGGGETRLGLRWQGLEQQGLVPAIGVYAALTSAYGETSRPANAAEISLLASSTVVQGPRPVGLYLNAGIASLLSPQPEERPNYYRVAAGIAHSVGQDTSIALSYLRQQQDRGLMDQSLVVGGIWHRLGGGGPILSATAGAGIGRDSPSLVLGIAAKWVFGAD